MRALLAFMIFVGKALLLLLGSLLVVGGGTCVAGGGFDSAGALGIGMLILGAGMLALLFRKPAKTDQRSVAHHSSEEEK